MRRSSRYAFTLVELPVVSRRKREAFTLVELLVVIGILVLLISILLPVVNKAYKNAQRTSMQADIAAISQALDAYRQTFADYPRIDATFSNVNTTNYFGSVMLCWALVAPGPDVPVGSAGAITGADGALGPGFRVRGTQGTIYPSFLNLDRFKIATIDYNGNITIPTNPNGFSDSTTVILDRFKKPLTK